MNKRIPNGAFKEHHEDGTWRHKRIALKPSSTDRSFDPIVLEDLVEDRAALDVNARDRRRMGANFGARRISV
jgi:hypothetical protein